MNRVFGQSLVLLALTAVAAVLTGWLHPRAPNFDPQAAAERSPLAITWTEVEALDGNTLWVDARSEQDYLEAHIPGAILLNENQWNDGFDNLIMTWSPDETVVVYCDGAACHVSEAVAIRLRRELGADNIYYLEGGWATWQAYGSE